MPLVRFNKPVLEIRGAISNVNASDLQALIEKSLDAVTRLVINLKHISHLDLAGVFMLHLIQERALKKSKLIVLQGLDNIAVQNAFRDAGLLTKNYSKNYTSLIG